MSVWTSIKEFFTVETPQAQADRLERLAAIVDRGLRSYAEAGAALAEIRDRQLYRLEAKTFEEFTTARWRMTPQHAGRLIAAAELAGKLEPTGTIPATERLARPIAALPEADQVEAWQEALEHAAGDQVRPEHVAAAVERRKPTRSKKPPKPIRIKVPGAIIIIEPGKAFTTAEAALQHALSQLRQRAAA